MLLEVDRQTGIRQGVRHLSSCQCTVQSHSQSSTRTTYPDSLRRRWRVGVRDKVGQGGQSAGFAGAGRRGDQTAAVAQALQGDVGAQPPSSSHPLSCRAVAGSKACLAWGAKTNIFHWRVITAVWWALLHDTHTHPPPPSPCTPPTPHKHLPSLSCTPPSPHAPTPTPHKHLPSPLLLMHLPPSPSPPPPSLNKRNWQLLQHSTGNTLAVTQSMQLYTDKCIPFWEDCVCDLFKKITMPHWQPHTVSGGYIWRVGAVTQGAYHGWRQSPHNYAVHNDTLM